jgi:hypothetical protein
MNMEQQSARKTFKYQLMPTPEQARTLGMVLWRCRELYNAGLQERKAAWEKRGVSVSWRYLCPSALMLLASSLRALLPSPSCAIVRLGVAYF